MGPATVAVIPQVGDVKRPPLERRLDYSTVNQWPATRRSCCDTACPARTDHVTRKVKGTVGKMYGEGKRLVISTQVGT